MSVTPPTAAPPSSPARALLAAAARRRAKRRRPPASEAIRRLVELVRTPLPPPGWTPPVPDARREPAGPSRLAASTVAFYPRSHLDVELVHAESLAELHEGRLAGGRGDTATFEFPDDAQARAFAEVARHEYRVAVQGRRVTVQADEAVFAHTRAATGAAFAGLDVEAVAERLVRLGGPLLADPFHRRQLPDVVRRLLAGAYPRSELEWYVDGLLAKLRDAAKVDVADRRGGVRTPAYATGRGRFQTARVVALVRKQRPDLPTVPLLGWVEALRRGEVPADLPADALALIQAAWRRVVGGVEAARALLKSGGTSAPAGRGSYRTVPASDVQWVRPQAATTQGGPRRFVLVAGVRGARVQVMAPDGRVEFSDYAGAAAAAAELRDRLLAGKALETSFVACRAFRVLFPREREIRVDFADFAAPLVPQPAARGLPRSHAFRVEPDGRVRVLGVPIFAENLPGEGVGRDAYDLRWLLAALQADRAHRAGGYQAPMHLGHHEPGLDRARAGTVALRGVRRCHLAGRRRWVLLADLVFDDAATAARARREFPYRSVEISPDRPREVNSLALLSSEAPYFRFPNLRFAAATEEFVTETTKAAQLATVVAKEANMDADKDKAPAAAAAESPEEKKLEAEAAPAWAQALLDGQAKVVALLEALLGAEEAEPAAPAVEPLPAPAEAPPVAAAAAARPAAAFDAASTRHVARLEGELRGTQERLAALQRERDDDKLFKGLEGELDGYALSTSWRAELRARVGKGPDAARAYVDGIKAQAPRLPSAGVGDAPPAEPADEPAVAAYAARGPAALGEARRLAALHAASRTRHTGFSHQTLPAFLAAQLGPEVK